MKPFITGVLTLRDTVVSDNKVTYNKVFGTGTSLVYTPTLNGVKEDIILSTYTGKSSFSFTIKTNGLAIVQYENDIFLADFEGNKVASLGDVIITDSANHTTYGTMTVVTKSEREEYTVTVNAPMEFLANPTTVYPVTVDPTFVIDEYTVDGFDYYSAIDDLCIYNGATNPYSNGIASIGNYSCYGETDPEVDYARMLYMLNPDYLFWESPMYYMDSSRMSSASLHLFGHTFQEEVTLYAYECLESWSDGTSTPADSILWDSHSNTYSSVTTVSSASFTDIEVDVTEIFAHWAEYDMYMDYGIMLMLNGEGNTDDTTCSYQVVLRQTEHAASNIYITVDYNYIDWGKIIAKGDRIETLQKDIIFEVESSGLYFVETSRLMMSSEGLSQNTILYLYDSEYNLLASNDDANSTTYYSKLSANLVTGRKYIIHVAGLVNSAGYYLCVYKQNTLGSGLYFNSETNTFQTAFDADAYRAYLYSKLCRNFVWISGVTSDYNCLAHALGNNSEWIWPWDTEYPTLEGVIDVLGDMGYVRVSQATSNCIVAYGDNSKITHFSKISNNIVTAKCGKLDLLQHNSYDAYYSFENDYYEDDYRYSYGEPVAFFVLNNSNTAQSISLFEINQCNYDDIYSVYNDQKMIGQAAQIKNDICGLVSITNKAKLNDEICSEYVKSVNIDEKIVPYLLKNINDSESNGLQERIIVSIVNEAMGVDIMIGTYESGYCAPCEHTKYTPKWYAYQLMKYMAEHS